MELQIPSATARFSPSAQATSTSPEPADVPRAGSERIVSIASFDSRSDRGWCELIRDIVALANSGGGEVLIRGHVDESSDAKKGSLPSDLTVDDVLRRLAEWTDSSPADIHVGVRGARSLAITVGPAATPIGFAKSATYDDPRDPSVRIEIFPAGSFYFRHGAQSVPGTSADLRELFERRLRGVQSQWLREFRRAVTLPKKRVAAPEPTQPTAQPPAPAKLQPVRIVTDPNAPALQPQDVERLYPWRQKDLLRELTRRLGRKALNSYDVQAVRRQHRLDERPDFVFHLEGAGRRYSPAALEWIMDRWERDPDFFLRARAADHEMLRLRRKKPR